MFLKGPGGFKGAKPECITESPRVIRGLIQSVTWRRSAYCRNICAATCWPIENLRADAPPAAPVTGGSLSKNHLQAWIPRAAGAVIDWMRELFAKGSQPTSRPFYVDRPA